MSARILIIEDNTDNLELMSYLLESFGHTALRASDGEAGLSMAKSEPPDLILCDIQLPKIDGYSVSRMLSTIPDLRTIPRVAVTALAMVGDKEKVMAAGFDGYIPKPIDPEGFVAQVERFIPAAKLAEPSPLPSPWPSPAAQPSPGNALPAVEPRGLILIVDNTPVNIEVIRCTLEPFGYRVIEASNADSAIRTALDRHPDLIISDVHMPRLDGFDLIRSVKAIPELASIPFIFVSSTFLGGDENRALSLGAARFINRPIESSRLLALIEEEIAGRVRK